MFPRHFMKIDNFFLKLENITNISVTKSYCIMEILSHQQNLNSIS